MLVHVMRVVLKASTAAVVLALVVAVLAGAVLRAAWLVRWGKGGSSSAPSTRDAGLTVERFRELSELTTRRVDVADALETRLAGRTGGVRALLLVRVDFTLGVDLSAARFEHAD